jgi:hypothetical protein
MKMKMEEKGKKKKAKGNRGGEGGIYIREVYRVEHPGSKRGRRDTQRNRERERERANLPRAKKRD